MPNPVPSHGNLSDRSPCEVLSALCRNGATGVLTLQGGGLEKSIYLEKGRIVFAASKDPDDRLGELLLTRGLVRREQLEEASSRVRPGKRLGTILVESGFLPAAELPRWVREQVKEIVFSVFSWGEGAHRFEAGPLPSGEVITLRISTAEIFLTGLRRVQKWSVLRKGAGEIRIPYRLAPGFRELLKDVQIGKEEESLLLLLESGESSMEQAARNSTLTTLLVYQFFFAFRVLGILLPAEGPAEGIETPRRETPSASPPAGEAPPPAAIPQVDPGAGARTVMLKVPQVSSAPVPGAVAPQEVPASSPVAKKREYKVVRVEGEKLGGNGTRLIEELLETWSREGYVLAEVVPAESSSPSGSSPSSYFIFARH